MDNSTPIFLTPIELPEYCFLSEAVEWIGLGRVPQAQYHLDSSLDKTTDYRFFWKEMPDNFEPDNAYFGFDKMEFESFGIPVNEEYFRAAEKCFGQYVHSLPDKIAEYEAKEPHIIEDSVGNKFNIWQSIADDDRIKLQELGPFQKIVDETEECFYRFYEIAWAKLFQLLQSGGIVAEAINYHKWEVLADNNEYEAAAQFVKVPGSEFGLNFNWNLNEMMIGETKFVSLRVRTSDIIKNRSVLLQQGVSTSVVRVGGYYETADTASPKFTRKRGRPNIVDWKVLKSYLNTLVQEGKIPDGRESCIFGLIAFAERTFGKTLSRSSVQRHLRTEMDAIYAQK